MTIHPRGARRPHGLLAGLMAVLVAVLVTACGPAGEPNIEVGDARASQRLAGASQVVVEVHNDGDGDDRLVAATTPAAIGAEIHLTTVDDDGRATMSTIDEVDIPAGEVVRFRPGGLHLMLTVPDESVVVGATFDLTLHFETSGEVTVPVTVVEQHELLEPAGEAVEP